MGSGLSLSPAANPTAIVSHRLLTHNASICVCFSSFQCVFNCVFLWVMSRLLLLFVARKNNWPLVFTLSLSLLVFSRNRLYYFVSLITVCQLVFKWMWNKQQGNARRQMVISSTLTVYLNRIAKIRFTFTIRKPSLVSVWNLNVFEVLFLLHAVQIDSSECANELIFFLFGIK